MALSAALAIGLGIAGIAVAPANAAGATQLLQDSFTGSTLTSSQYAVGGTGAASPAPGTNTACLTTPGAPAGQVPGSCPGASDISGSGALRLTAAAGSQTGYLLYNHALPTKAGLDIDFNTYQWGGSGADGITFFLTDGAYNLSSVGASGGSLGYSNSTAGSGAGQQGVPHGLIGVALDTFGNYSAETNNASCNTSTTWTARTPNEVAVRGPGVQTGTTWNDGYCLLGKAVTVSGGLDKTTATSRTSAARHVRIVVDPPTAATPQVKVYVGAMGDTTTAASQLPLITTVPEPAALQAATTFKFGWAASTGGSTDYHEINTLDVGTVNPITASLSETTTTPAAADAGSSTTATFQTSTLSTDGPIAAGTPVTMTITKDPGLAFGALSNQSGWTLQSSSGDTAVYSYTPQSLVVSGTALPNLSVPVSATAAGSYSLSAVVSGGGVDTTENPVSARTATASIAIRPTASPVSAAADATTAPASASPAPFTFSVPAAGGVGSATPSYALSTTPDAATGTASIDASTGAVTFTPAANWSGTTTFDYTATAGGVTSVPAVITVTTPPAVSDHADTVSYGATATVDLSSGAEGTGLGYALVATPPVASGAATLSGSTLTFVPATGFSGTATMTYRATDASSVNSATKTVSITVRPQAATDAISVSLDANGHATVSSTLPTPSGAGPFTYTLAAGPSDGTLGITSDGHDTYTAAAGKSGVFTASYTVTDASGAISDPTDVTVTVKPYAAPLTATTTADSPVTTSAPTTVGATGGTFAVVGPTSGGTATIDPATGKITLAPTAGTSGNVSLSYTVTANGVTSDPATVSIAVDPKITDHADTTPYNTADTVDVGAGAAGTGLSFAIVTDAGSAGSSTIDATSGALVFTPTRGFSGVATITYAATDHDSLVSTKTVTIHVRPAATTSRPTIALPPTGNDPSTFPLPAPSGTGPFTYALVPGSTSAGGTFAIDASTGVVTFTPAKGVSGVVTAQYVVTDGAGNTSPAQTISLTVQPFTSAAATTVSAGAASDRLALPAAVGTGPFTYQLVGAPTGVKGTASIDQATGVITFVPTDRASSGAVTVDYTVTDGNNIASTPARAALTIKPTTADVFMTAQGAASNPASVKLAPHTVGTGPFTYHAVGAASGVTVLATGSGFTVTPAVGYTGKVVFTFRAVDAAGISSDPATATVNVLPFRTQSQLARTGSNVSVLAPAAGLIILAAGVFLVALSRRRRTAS